MRTKNNRRSLRRHLSKSHRKSYRGGQARWPAPFNPAPPHQLPSVGCRFPKSRKSKSKKSKSIKI